MSNQVTIMPTKFVSLGGSEIKWGVRVSDNYGSSFDDTWLQEDVDCVFNQEKQIYEKVDPLKILLKVCLTNNPQIADIIDAMIKQELGIWIDSDWFDWEEIKEIVVGPT